MNLFQCNRICIFDFSNAAVLFQVSSWEPSNVWQKYYYSMRSDLLDLIFNWSLEYVLKSFSNYFLVFVDRWSWQVPMKFRRNSDLNSSIQFNELFNFLGWFLAGNFPRPFQYRKYHLKWHVCCQNNIQLNYWKKLLENISYSYVNIDFIC